MSTCPLDLLLASMTDMDLQAAEGLWTCGCKGTWIKQAASGGGREGGGRWEQKGNGCDLVHLGLICLLCINIVMSAGIILSSPPAGGLYCSDIDIIVTITNDSAVWIWFKGPWPNSLSPLLPSVVTDISLIVAHTFTKTSPKTSW